MNISLQGPQQISSIIENAIIEERIFHHSKPNTQIKNAISRKILCVRKYIDLEGFNKS